MEWAPSFAVLTIAGSDSSGGAGVQADARTIHALGGYACTAITAITAQNSRGVRAWRPVPAALVVSQIAAALEGSPVAAAKTGLLPGAASVRGVAECLLQHPQLPLVVDPVLGSTSGTRFLDEAGVRALRRHLLPRATLVTPNWPEAAALTRRRVTTFAEAEAAARALAADTGCAVLVTGGHAPGNSCRDCLVTADGQRHWYMSRRIATRNTHGTGCVLSAAIASELSKRSDIADAVVQARRFLQRALRQGSELRRGEAGAGAAFAGHRATPRDRHRSG